MSKVIRVGEEVYLALDRLRVGRQTFADVIKELLTMKVTVFELLSVLEGQVRYRQEQGEKLDAVTKARAESTYFKPPTV